MSTDNEALRPISAKMVLKSRRFRGVECDEDGVSSGRDRLSIGAVFGEKNLLDRIDGVAVAGGAIRGFPREDERVARVSSRTITEVCVKEYIYHRSLCGGIDLSIRRDVRSDDLIETSSTRRSRGGSVVQAITC